MAKREPIAWITKGGKHIPIFADEPTEDEKKKDREIAANKKQADEKNGTVTALHFTSSSNAKSILSNDFDLNKSGEHSPSKKKFVNFGKAIYFTNGEAENEFYSMSSRATNTAIEATIDISKMKEINLGGHPMKSYDAMYETVISQLPANIQKEYYKYIQSHKSDRHSKTYISSDAFSTIIPRYYSGLVIKQKQSDEFDYISGGNQIVVYDTSVIKNKKIRKGN